jgi:hypothetical protein
MDYQAPNQTPSNANFKQDFLNIFLPKNVEDITSQPEQSGQLDIDLNQGDDFDDDFPGQRSTHHNKDGFRKTANEQADPDTPVTPQDPDQDPIEPSDPNKDEPFGLNRTASPKS